MIAKSSATRVAMTAGLVAAFWLALFAEAQAAEVKVLTFLSSRPVLTDLGPQFERASGHKLAIVYGSIEPLRDRVAAGEVADVTITSRQVLDALASQGKIAPGGVADVGRISIRLFVTAGAAKPDIGSVEALKRTLLAAQSVAYTNPARGALAGRSFFTALERMGIADQVKAKANIIPGLGHDMVAAVARREATIGAAPTNDVTPPPDGIDILGGLPKELGSDIVLSAAVLANAPSSVAAMEFVKFLASPVGAAAMKTHGLEP